MLIPHARKHRPMRQVCTNSTALLNARHSGRGIPMPCRPRVDAGQQVFHAGAAVLVYPAGGLAWRKHAVSLAC
jgi:hypothetical protein